LEGGRWWKEKEEKEKEKEKNNILKSKYSH
jgi:hypothetical protein